MDGSGSPVNALASESGADDSPISTPTVGGAKTLRNAPRRTGVTGVTKIDIKKKKTKVSAHEEAVIISNVPNLHYIWWLD